MFNRPERPKAKPAVKVAVAPGKSRKETTEQDGVSKSILTTVAFAMLALLLAANAPQPRIATVGDTLDFTPKTVSDTAPVTAVSAEILRPGKSSAETCTLDATAMAHPGGVLTVFAVPPKGVDLLWAGHETASGVTPCPSGEPLLVSNDGYERLQRAQTFREPRNPH